MGKNKGEVKKVQAEKQYNYKQVDSGTCEKCLENYKCDNYKKYKEQMENSKKVIKVGYGVICKKK